MTFNPQNSDNWNVAQIGLAIFLFIPIWTEFSASGLVERLPTAILCLGLVITALLTFSCGILLMASQDTSNTEKTGISQSSWPRKIALDMKKFSQAVIETAPIKNARPKVNVNKYTIN